MLKKEERTPGKWFVVDGNGNDVGVEISSEARATEALRLDTRRARGLRPADTPQTEGAWVAYEAAQAARVAAAAEA